MPNIAKVLKDEISRISRKEVKAAVSPLRRPSVRSRRDLANLKRRVALLEKESKRLQSMLAGVTKAQHVPVPETVERVRMTAKGVTSLRRKLRLSQVQFAALLGVSPQIVQVWEKKQGTLKLRDTTKAAILSARAMGAREAQERLAEIPKKAKKVRKSKKVRKTVRRRRR